MKLIELNKLKQALSDNGMKGHLLLLVNKIIDNCPVIEQKHGAWVYDENGMDWNIGAFKCSECGCKNDNLPNNVHPNPNRFVGSNFCPNCGADMRKEGK